jgi:hypothetical protein
MMDGATVVFEPEDKKAKTPIGARFFKQPKKQVCILDLNAAGKGSAENVR